MTIAFTPRASVFPAALGATLLFGVDLVSAQQQPAPPVQTRQFDAPVGHRQPRAADIPQTKKTPAELLEEQQQAALNRSLKICRGC